VTDAKANQFSGVLSDGFPMASASPQKGGVFACVKCTMPIPAPTALCRRALILAALDPEVLSITVASRPAIATLHRATGDSLLVVGAAPLLARLDGLSDSAVFEVVTSLDVSAEPRLSNALAVWSTRNRFVAIGDQVRVLAHLDDVGVAPLIEVARSATSAFDGVAAVLTLCCRGLVAIDLETEPIGPETRVRRVPKPA
jgi:hypothetical protein